MNAKGDYISPVRAKSKLKKRRRQRESSVSTCSLQKVAVAPAISDVKNKKPSNDDVTHVSNERDGIRYTSSVKKENNNDCSVKPFPRSNRSKGLTDPSLSHNNRDGASHQTSNNTISGTHSKSKLSYIDEMELSELSSFGNDILCSFTDVDIASELKRAFISSNNDSIGKIIDDYNPFYHDGIGRIGPPKRNEHAFSIAFPRSSALNTSEIGAEGYNIPTSFQNMKRSTCYGMNIPLSWCQFPSPQREQTTARTNDDASIVMDQLDNAKEEITIIEKEKEVATSYRHKYQGKVRITSIKGATIREVFDIDESDHVIGKLYQGDERCFVEKRMLPKPPPDSDDDFDDDESDDEECVDVLRYKIVLDAHDCIGCSHDDIAKDISTGEMFGWISDRGRLASDPYFILKEIDNMNSE